MREGSGQRSGKPDEYRAFWVPICVVAVLVAIGGVGSVILSLHGSAGSSGQAKYAASVDMSKAVVVNPKTLRVYGTVKNIGDGAGTPACMLYAHDNSYSYTTEGAVEGSSPLAPGRVWSFNTDLGLTRQGARITAVDVQCG